MPPDAHSLVLHQYATSPFSEKIRKLLAHKRVAWFAVEQPNMMPKPDLLPLTGGYRRIPVLQIGADVYCDSQLIARVLEGRNPTPSLYPDGSEATCHAWNLWADRVLFMPAVAVVFADIGHMVPAAFIEDRSRMMPGRDFSEVPRQAPAAREQIRALVATLDAQLADGRPYLLGRTFSLADAACFHPLWFFGWRVGRPSRAVRPRPPDGPWTPWDRATRSRSSRRRRWRSRGRPSPPRRGRPGEPNGLPPATRSRSPRRLRLHPVRGTIVAASAHEIAIRRTDPARRRGRPLPAGRVPRRPA
jgi:glutathione S-transferase